MSKKKNELREAASTTTDATESIAGELTYTEPLVDLMWGTHGPGLIEILWGIPDITLSYLLALFTSHGSRTMDLREVADKYQMPVTRFNKLFELMRMYPMHIEIDPILLTATYIGTDIVL